VLSTPEFRAKKGLGAVACDAISLWIKNSFESQFKHLSSDNFRGVRCFGVRTTTWSESENSTIKRHNAGVRPHMSLDRSAHALSQVEEQRSRKRKRRADHGALTVPGRNNSALVSVEGATRQCSECLTGEYQLRTNYACMLDPHVESVVWVKETRQQQGE
jgi:hypothetical protein